MGRDGRDGHGFSPIRQCFDKDSMPCVLRQGIDTTVLDLLSLLL